MNDGHYIFSREHKDTGWLFDLNKLTVPKKGLLRTGRKSFIASYNKILNNLNIEKAQVVIRAMLEKNPNSCDHLIELNSAFLKFSKNEKATLLQHIYTSPIQTREVVQSPPSVIDQIPNEIKLKIFDFLGTYNEVRNAGKVCREWRNISLGVLNKLYFPFMLREIFSRMQIPGDNDWESKFVNHFKKLSFPEQITKTHAFLKECQVSLGKLRGLTVPPLERVRAMDRWAEKLYTHPSCPPGVKAAMKEGYLSYFGVSNPPIFHDLPSQIVGRGTKWEGVFPQEPTCYFHRDNKFGVRELVLIYRNGVLEYGVVLQAKNYGYDIELINRSLVVGLPSVDIGKIPPI